MHNNLRLTPEWSSLRYWIDIIFLMVLIPLISTVSILADAELQGMTIVWWPAAIPISVYWFRGSNRWLGIFLGYLIHYYLTYPAPEYGLADYAWMVAIVNSVEAIIILRILKKSGVDAPFQKWSDTWRFVLYGLLPIGMLTSAFAHLFFWMEGVELRVVGFYWWYAGNVVAALVLVPFIMVFVRPRPLLSIRTHPAVWFFLVFLSLGLAIIIYFPNSFLTMEQQCLTSAFFLPLYVGTAFLLGMIGVVTILLIGGIISNLSYSQGIGVCNFDGSFSVELLWAYMIILPVCFLLLAGYLDHRRGEGGEV